MSVGGGGQPHKKLVLCFRNLLPADVVGRFLAFLLCCTPGQKNVPRGSRRVVVFQNTHNHLSNAVKWACVETVGSLFIWSGHKSVVLLEMYGSPCRGSSASLSGNLASVAERYGFTVVALILLNSSSCCGYLSFPYIS